MVQGHQALCLHVNLVESVGCLGKLGILEVLAHKGLHHANGCNVLLHVLVQVVVGREHLLEQACHPDNDEVKRGAEDDECHHEDDGHARVDDHAHADGHKQLGRCTQADAEQLLIGLLQRVHVGGHARHEARRAVFVNVGEGKRLYVAVHGRAQVGSKTGGGVGRRAARTDAEQHAEHGHAQHDGSVNVDLLHVAGIDATVNEQGRRVGYQHIHHHLKRGEQRSEQRRRAVLPDLSV